jgi:hypothetical protein
VTTLSEIHSALRRLFKYVRKQYAHNLKLETETITRKVSPDPRVTKHFCALAY